MKRYDIIFRSVSVTNRLVRINLNNFFIRKNFFKSDYIISNIEAVINNKSYLLSKNVLINRKDNQEIQTLIKNVLSCLTQHNIVLNSGNIISIYYIESDLAGYKAYKAKISNLGKRFYSTFTNLGKRFYSTKNPISFKNAEYPIEPNTTLTDIKPYFDKFINENKINFGQYISVICQIREVRNIYYTIGDRFAIDLNNSKEIKDYLDYIQNKWSILDNNQYNPSLALSVLFNFNNTSYSNYSLISNKFRITQNQSKVDVNFKDESNFDLPLNTYYNSWGKTSEMLSDGILRVKDLFIDLKSNLNRYIEVTTLSKYDSLVNLISSESNIKIITFLDKIISNNEFIRELGNKTYYFKDNKLYFIYDKLISKQFISKARPSQKNIFNIMTLDVETYVDENNNMNIYCISMYDGVNAKSFYLTNYTDVHSLINDVLKTIFSKKYSGKSIYIHNSSNFDMIFLYSYIINYSETSVKPILKDGKFIVLDIEFGNITKYKVYFKDSFLLLSSSLAKLSKSFNVNYTKDIFPHKFVNKDNLNYIGEVPTIDFFNGISTTEYNEYKSRFNNNWNLESEAIKYCELDCKALFEVISNFAIKINQKFNVDVSSTPTLPSVAMKTYRTSFIPDGIKISKIGGKMFDNIHNAFYGGHVDMYIPTNPVGTQVFGYDVNSLYPYVMKVNKYPYQFIAHFYGDISNMKQYFNLYNKCVGFFKVNITSPQNILHPILPKKVNNTTVYGVGSWTGWYYSEELKNAAKFGYKFDILEGYLFKSTDLFSKYIDTMYQMKEIAVKNSPDYMIPKFLQNSLFGKFSMFRELINYAVLDQHGVDQFISKIGFDNFINKVDFGSKCLVSYKLQFQKDLNINIAIGAAVTANARVYMSQFKNIQDFSLYYSDTDSIFIDKPLSQQLVSDKKLGLMKLEYVLTKFVALGPKVYGGININGIEFTKTKGLKTKITVNQLLELLNENNSINVPQEKWFNQLVDSTISIKETSYNLKPTDYKRKLVYKNGVLIGTENKDVSDSY